jgi:hypothetical protein
MPAGRRILADPPVHGLTDQVGVPSVPAILLDQIADEAAQAAVSAVGHADARELVKAAVG